MRKTSAGRWKIGGRKVGEGGGTDAAGGRPKQTTRVLSRVGYLRLTSDQDQMTRPTMHFCQSPSKSSMRLKTRGGLSAALSE